METVLELRDITKQFPGVLANDHINLTLNQGEIHALLGENGAGKSTLMNILYGLYQPTKGEIFVRGKKVELHGPGDAIRAGIGMVHQHFMLIPVFTVTENVMLGEESVKVGDMLDRQVAAKRIKEISDRFGLQVDPNAMVGDLPVGVQQRVEIIKLLYREADILIFDEPTAVLTPQEADALFEIMHSLTSQGKSIIFITHKLREVLEAADRISVIRRGKKVGEADPKTANQQSLADLMVGRAVALEVEKNPVKLGAVHLEIKALHVSNDANHETVKNVSFDVHGGEVMGIAGVQGNGQTELVEAVTGLRPITSGTIKLMGDEINHASPRQITERGLAHVPEDRQRDGLVLQFPITDNLALQEYYRPPYSQGMVMQDDYILKHANELIKEFDIRTPNAITPAGALSGGNQQKVIVARELTRPIKLLVASQPTRGVDVGSIEFIHDQILARRDQGCAVLLVSTELDEVMKLSDRIAVMFDGKVTAIVERSAVTKEQVGLLMAGASLQEALGDTAEKA
ncbi:MAG TPA: ABC transporter ATP-binding protein [Anaerolineales bacterium]|nr:ABC transporter ATP-binding protein [Anaerolineales bacterium]